MARQGQQRGLDPREGLGGGAGGFQHRLGHRPHGALQTELVGARSLGRAGAQLIKGGGEETLDRPDRIDLARGRGDAAGYPFAGQGGGALGLFTAIRRLKAVYERLGPELAKAGIPLYAQHVDPLEVGALVDVFRAERDSCLLGTDAVRDGVDVPGRSLRLLAFDRAPWPRPDLLHRARRQRFGGEGAAGRAWDDALARGRIAQAFGRLIRRADDRGVFVMLDAATPTRLFAALPPGAEVRRMGLADAVEVVREFLD
ncbi:MAG: helicase C-terminal domain-containing protein [Brevundimonas sp.]